MTEAFESLWSKRLVVCVGPGGVGKTTTAAAIGVRAADSGKRTLVLTIDPARRLADALGIRNVGDRALPVSAAERLDVAMLDTRESFDNLIRRVAPESSSEILQNRVYKAFSKTLARSHAYVAAERLYEAMQSGRYDFIVLDTPPTRSALDILDAPSNLVNFLDREVLRSFLGEKGKRSFAMNVLLNFTGDGAFSELLTFLSLMAKFRDGFEDRARVVREAFVQPSTAFVLVASSSRTSLDDARFLAADLKRRGIAPTAVCFNRVIPEMPCAFTDDTGLLTDAASNLLLRLREVGRTRDSAHQEALAMARAFKRISIPQAQLWCIEERLREVMSVPELRQLAADAYVIPATPAEAH